MNRSTNLALVLTLLAATGLAADPARFSGTWKENLEKSTKSTLTSYVNKIDASADVVVVKTTSNGPRGERTSERTYTIGKEVKSKMSDGDEAITNAKWEGDALVILQTIKEPDGPVDHKETWTVSADGKTLTKQRHSHSAKGDHDETHILENNND